MVTREEVRLFLLDVKTALARGEFHLVDRDKNLPHILDLGVKVATVEGIVARLDTCDYSQGPLPHDTRAGETVWIFGPDFEGSQLYIKLTLRKGGVDCISVHRAERPLYLPFRATEGRSRR